MRRPHKFLLTRILLASPILFTLVFVGCGEFSFSVGNKEHHGTAPTTPKLIVKGQANHFISVGITNYDFYDGNASSWNSTSWRYMIPSSGELSIDMEPGHDGYRVEVIIPTAISSTVTMLSDGKEITSTNTDDGGLLTLKAGTVTKDDESHAYEIRVTQTQQKRLRQILEAFESGDTTGVVSELDDLLVDASVLNSYSSVTKQYLGNIADLRLNEWATWEAENEGNRFYGPIEFENGDAIASLVIVDERLAAFYFDSDAIPNPWFTQPENTEPYRAKGENLVRAMLRNDMEVAHQFLAKAYRENITQQQLGELATQILEVVSPSIKSIQVVDEKVTDVLENILKYSVVYEVMADDQSKRRFEVLYEFAFQNDKKLGMLCGIYCLPNQDGEFDAILDEQKSQANNNRDEPNGPSSDETLDSANGNMANDETPSWKDRQKLIAVELVKHGAKADVDEFRKLLHPDAQKLLDTNRLQEQLERIRTNFGEFKTIDQENIQLQGTEKNLNIVCPFEFANTDATCTIHYVDYQPVGIHVASEIFVADTLGAVKPQIEMIAHASEFWREMFIGDQKRAFEMMFPDEMQKLMPMDSFLKYTAQLRMPDGVEIDSLDLLAVRLTVDGENTDEFCLSVYQRIVFSDGKYGTGRMRYTISNDQFQSIQFDTGNFDDEFPIEFFGPQEQFCKALALGDAEKFAAMFFEVDEPPHMPTLTAFLNQLASKTGKFKRIIFDSFSGTHSFSANGVEYMKANGTVEFENLKLQLTCEHRGGKTDGFLITKKGLFDNWTDQIDDMTLFANRGSQFVEQMLKRELASTVELASSEFQEVLNSDMDVLTTGVNDFLEENGELVSIAFTRKEKLEDSSEWKFHYDLKFEKKEGVAEVVFEFNPFGAELVSFNFEIVKDNEAEALEKDSVDDNSLPQ